MLINTGILFTNPAESSVNSYFKSMVPGSWLVWDFGFKFAGVKEGGEGWRDGEMELRDYSPRL